MPDPDAPLSATLAAIRAIEQAATPGEWKHRTAEGRGDWTTGSKPIAIERVEADARPGGIGIIDAWEDAEFIASARNAFPRLLAALEAVLKLHQPVMTNGGWLEGREWQECGECGPNNGCEDIIASPGQGESFWPCPTCEAITAELTGKEAGDETAAT